MHTGIPNAGLADSLRTMYEGKDALWVRAGSRGFRTGARQYPELVAAEIERNSCLMPRPAPSLIPPFSRPKSRVAIRNALTYQSDIAAILYETIREFNLPVQGKTVLPTPQLVGSDRLGHDKYASRGHRRRARNILTSRRLQRPDW